MRSVQSGGQNRKRGSRGLLLSITTRWSVLTELAGRLAVEQDCARGEPALVQAGNAQISDHPEIFDHDRVLSCHSGDQKARDFGVAILERLMQRGHFQRVIVGARPLHQQALHLVGLTSGNDLAKACGEVEQHISRMSPRIHREALRGQSPEQAIREMKPELHMLIGRRNNSRADRKRCSNGWRCQGVLNTLRDDVRLRCLKSFATSSDDPSSRCSCR